MTNMTILDVTFLIVAAQVVLLPYLLYVRRRAKKSQDAIVEQLRGSRFWRVAISRPDHLKSILKISAIQALAVLIDEGEYLCLKGHWSGTGEAFSLKFPKQSVRVSCDENRSLMAGNMAWVRISHPAGDLMMAADTGLNVANSREALADLVRSAFPFSPLSANAFHDFALEKNSRSMAVTVVFFVLLAFALFDTYVFSAYELIDAQIDDLLDKPLIRAAGIAITIALAVPVYRYLVAGKVPVRESLALAVLLLTAIALSAFPALKRIDQRLADGVSADYQYRVIDSVVNLEPVDASQELPRLRFKKAPEYWAQFPVGSEVTIPLLRGPIGLWQLDHARFDPPIFSFYEKRKK